MAEVTQSSKPFAIAMQTIAKYYPKNCLPSEGFELSREWKQQACLRDKDLPLHQEAIRKLTDQMKIQFPPRAIDENSCVSLYPCYNLRILIEPIMWLARSADLELGCKDDSQVEDGIMD